MAEDATQYPPSLTISNMVLRPMTSRDIKSPLLLVRSTKPTGWWNIGGLYVTDVFNSGKKGKNLVASDENIEKAGELIEQIGSMDKSDMLDEAEFEETRQRNSNDWFANYTGHNFDTPSLRAFKRACCWVNDECEGIIMRRPTFCSIFDEEENPVTSGPTSSDKESRLSKVKRIITGTILLGRKTRKESVQSQTEQDDQENSLEYGDKGKSVDLAGQKMKLDEQFQKSKSVQGPKTKSCVRRYDETMDTENIPNTSEISVCLSKEHTNGKTLKEITIEITKNTPSPDTEILLKPKKRKERLDSGGSVKQDNKVIRSNSEERPEDNEGKNRDMNIRRVSSHEDFSRVRILQEVNSIQTTTNQDMTEVKPMEPKEDGFNIREMFHNAEEIEHEKRRSCERFSRALAPIRGRRSMQKRKMKMSKKIRDPGNDATERQTQMNGQSVINNHSEKDRSPSPSSSPPALDISTLHKQMEGSEPITSRGKIISPDEESGSPTAEALISPRNSLVMRLSHLDPSLPPSPPRDHNMRLGNFESQERRLCKQINSIKRQLKRYEDGFQAEFGYRPSHADKQANKDIKKLCLDLNKYRTQLKQIKEDNAAFHSDSTSGKPLSFLTSLEGSYHNTSPNNSKHSKSNKTMEEVFQEVEKRLQDKRQQSGRSTEISEMSRGDLLEEKVAVQKALLHLENAFGRPVTREDRDLVRPLYQRYRLLKRLVVRSSSGKLNNSTGELATILEHETMEFTTSPSSSFDIGEGTSSAPEGLNLTQSSVDTLKKNQVDDIQNSSSSSDSLGENLHALPLSQLLEQQKSAKEEKKKLRRSLREFEDSFRNETGRRAQKQDRIIVEGIYTNYKQMKAKLRLLDALIAKKSCVKRNSC